MHIYLLMIDILHAVQTV